MYTCMSFCSINHLVYTSILPFLKFDSYFLTIVYSVSLNRVNVVSLEDVMSAVCYDYENKTDNLKFY